MTPFIYRDPFTAHEVAPELSADEQAVVERFGIHEPNAADSDRGMTVYLIDGPDLRMVIDALADKPYALRVAIDEGGVKFKLDNYSWSPALGSEEK